MLGHKGVVYLTQLAEDPVGDRPFPTFGVPDCDHLLPNSDAVGVTKRKGRQPERGYFDYGEISLTS